MSRQLIRTLIGLTVAFAWMMLALPTSIHGQNVTDWVDQQEQNEQQQDQIPEQEIPTNDPSSGSLLWNIFKMIIVLLLILGLLYTVLRVMNKRKKLLHEINVLENIGGISVGQNKTIQLIRVGSHFYLVGVGENVQLLQEIEEEEVLEELLQLEPKRPSEDIPFLSSLLNRSTTKESEKQQPFSQLFSKELDTLVKNRTKLITKHNEKEDINE